MATEEQILKALSQIIDPDLHKDIVSLGFIKNLKIAGGDISFDIALTTPACPVRHEFQQKAEDLLKALPGIKNVSVNLTSQPLKQSPSGTNAKNALSNIGSIIAVSSCKGGVGKSTVAAHLAVELSRRGFKVGLVDADIHGPSVPTLFRLTNTEIFANDKDQLIPIEQGNLKIMSFGFLLGDAPAVMRGPMVSRYVQQVLLNTAWGKLDYLFVDMPPGTGDVQLTITQSVRLSGAVIVTTRQTLSLVDVARGILMFEKVSVPILGIIENMSYFVCDKCEKKHYIFGGEKQSQLSERFGVELLAEIPLLSVFAEKITAAPANPFIVQAVDKVIMALGKSQLTQSDIPEVSVGQAEIQLAWKDGEKISVPHNDLRASCQCALCVNEITGEKILKPQNIRPDIAPKEIVPLGNYALGITWNDGHSSGIYPYKLIRSLAAVRS